MAVSNTGVNGAVGNASTNDSSVDQTATADASGSGDAVAVNTANSSNNSGGSASINTGDANSTGNQASNSSAQVLHADDDAGITVADQNNRTTNTGIGVANTGVNGAVGNLSTNSTDVDQTADADTNGKGDAVAVNTANSSNNSTGHASITTGDASAIGNSSWNTNLQVIDTGDSNLTVVDQNNKTQNVGFGLANSGFNLALGNLSDNTATPASQSATASGGNGDAVAVNDGWSVNNSTGAAAIHTGNANATGNHSHDSNTQVIDADGVSATRAGSNPAILLALLLSFLFVGTPVRRLATRRR